MEVHSEQTSSDEQRVDKGQMSKLFDAFQSHLLVVVSIISIVIFFALSGSGSFVVQWTAFMIGILFASSMASFTREKLFFGLNEQIAKLKRELDTQIQVEKNIKETLASTKPILDLLDEVNSIMIAFVDREGRYQYHNRAFREWLNLRPERVTGRRMRDVLGIKPYDEIAAHVRQALEGIPVHYDQRVKLPDGTMVMISVDHIPQLAEDKTVLGFSILAVVVAKNLSSIPLDTPEGGKRIKGEGMVKILTPEEWTQPEAELAPFSEEMSRQQDEGFQLLNAIEKGEFSLYCQRILPLINTVDKTDYYEILIRLTEEEISAMPPGVFFPLAEKHGLMPYLDRWVLRQVIEFIALRKHQYGHVENIQFFINMSLATLVDPGFHEYLKQALVEYEVDGNFFCFEMPLCDLAFRAADLAEFAKQSKLCGCSVSLSGFGRDQVRFEQIQGMQVDFLKIDGTIVSDICSDLVKLSQVIAIQRVTQKIGIRTIAELAENEETIEKLKEIGIDYAQGFEISRPLPLDDIKLS